MVNVHQFVPCKSSSKTKKVHLVVGHCLSCTPDYLHYIQQFKLRRYSDIQGKKKETDPLLVAIYFDSYLGPSKGHLFIKCKSLQFLSLVPLFLSQ